MKLLNLASDKLISRVKFAAVRNNGAGLSGDRYRDGGDGGKGKGLDPPPPFQLQGKIKKILLCNERSISELQDVKIFWGRIPPAPPKRWWLQRSLVSLPPPNSKYAPPSLSKPLARANEG